jgi:hypothetical protein
MEELWLVLSIVRHGILQDVPPPLRKIAAMVLLSLRKYVMMEMSLVAAHILDVEMIVCGEKSVVIIKLSVLSSVMMVEQHNNALLVVLEHIAEMG